MISKHTIELDFFAGQTAQQILDGFRLLKYRYESHAYREFSEVVSRIEDYLAVNR
jgi:hypothetical protein